jgi:cytochrome b561
MPTDEEYRMRARYTRTAIGLHWIIFLAIAGMMILGFYVHGLHFSPTRIRLVNYHKWSGVTLFLLVLFRLLWRLSHEPPPLPDTMSRLTRRAALASHRLLYLLMFAIPLSGWLMSSAMGYQTVWFGIVPLPNLVQRSAPLGAHLLELHATLNFVLIILAAGHAGAALKHHFIDHDDVLKRMMH